MYRGGGWSTGLGNIPKKLLPYLKYEKSRSAKFCRLNYALGGFVFAIGGGSALWRGKATYRSPLDEPPSAWLTKLSINIYYCDKHKNIKAGE